MDDSIVDHIAASIEGFFWPKMFFDFYTKNFDKAVKPIPILQIINLVFGLITFAYEWPLRFLAGSAIHRSMELRVLIWLPLMSLSCALMYQATDPALYYLIGLAAYFWAYSEGEVSISSIDVYVLFILTSYAGYMCSALDITEENRQEDSTREGMTWMMMTIPLLHCIARFGRCLAWDGLQTSAAGTGPSSLLHIV